MPDITHTAVGWTRTGVWPTGFRPMHHRICVGTGEAAFQRLAEGILTLELHRRSKLHIDAAPRAAVGGTVVVGFGIGNLRIKAPCEVVWVEEASAQKNDGGGEGGGGKYDGEHDNDDGDVKSGSSGARRAGFGYATLPGHPESGEESFAAVLDADGTVFFELHAYSRHANWFYRLGAPVARFCQELVTRRYLAAARQLAG